MSSNSSKIERVSGRAVPVPGDDIDTDRIIPARYLKTITFEGLEDHLFEDDRRELTAQGRVHPVDQPQHQGARILVVQGNFGCGSSREHAPQAIKRWGIHAVIGESFAEIFFGNSVMLGLPSVTASKSDVAKLLALAESRPDIEFTVDLMTKTVTAGDLVVAIAMPPASRAALLSGDWDATNLLVDRYDEVERAAAALPYLSNWGAASA
jgi:3-isopropylmalate/(R)-2-methylmalate dehydratase small subunit